MAESEMEERRSEHSGKSSKRTWLDSEAVEEPEEDGVENFESPEESDGAEKDDEIVFDRFGKLPATIVF